MVTLATPALFLPALLTHDQATVCARTLGLGIQAEQSEAVCIDASALEKFDSSALAVLLQCRRDSVASGKSFAVTGQPLKLLELADLYGIGELLQSQSGSHIGA
jgi:phospholipid transport system transporter-binding protein